MVRRQQEIIFVSGKGGVGKSTVALALAKKQAAKGKKVLLVELGDHSYYQDYLSGLEVGYHPVNLVNNLDIAIWSGRECLREYALYLLKLESLYKIFFENKVSRALIDVAPALAELAMLGKITSGVRGVGPDLPYDILVVDGFSTGHMMALLRAPRGMLEAISFGPMGEQSRTMLETIRNPQNSSYVLVALAEELPVIETEELFELIHREVGIKPSLVVNRLLPDPEKLKIAEGSSVEEATLKQLRAIHQYQNILVQRLRQLNSNLQIIPFFPSNDPTQLSKQMESSLC